MQNKNNAKYQLSHFVCMYLLACIIEYAKSFYFVNGFDCFVLCKAVRHTVQQAFVHHNCYTKCKIRQQQTENHYSIIMLNKSHSI